MTAAAGTAAITTGTKGERTMKIAKILTAIGVLALLSGCVVYMPGSAPPPRYHYWR
jgi:hypothetical protein